MGRKVLAVVALMVLMVTAAYSQQKKLRFFGGLFMPDYETRLDAYSSALREREEKIQELISIVEGPSTDNHVDGPRALAIGLVGIYRAQEAVGSLVDRLTFLPVGFEGLHSSAGTPTQLSYPAVQALLQIGVPPVGALIHKISFTDDKEERELAAWVLMKFLGKEEALKVLEIDAKRTSNEYKARLKAAAEYLRTFKQTHGILPLLRSRKAPEASNDTPQTMTAGQIR